MGMPGVTNTSQFRIAFSEVCSITMSPMFCNTDTAGLPGESGTLKMNKPDRIAHAQIDGDESNETSIHWNGGLATPPAYSERNHPGAPACSRPSRVPQVRRSSGL